MVYVCHMTCGSLVLGRVLGRYADPPLVAVADLGGGGGGGGG